MAAQPPIPMFRLFPGPIADGDHGEADRVAGNFHLVGMRPSGRHFGNGIDVHFLVETVDHFGVQRVCIEVRLRGQISHSAAE